MTFTYNVSVVLNPKLTTGTTLRTRFSPFHVSSDFQSGSSAFLYITYWHSLNIFLSYRNYVSDGYLLVMLWQFLSICGVYYCSQGSSRIVRLLGWEFCVRIQHPFYLTFNRTVCKQIRFLLCVMYVLTWQLSLSGSNSGSWFEISVYLCISLSNQLLCTD